MDCLYIILNLNLNNHNLDPKPSAADPTALTKSRPQQPSPDALRFLDFNALTTVAAASGLINVYSVDHQRSYGIR